MALVAKLAFLAWPAILVACATKDLPPIDEGPATIDTRPPRPSLEAATIVPLRTLARATSLERPDLGQLVVGPRGFEPDVGVRRRVELGGFGFLRYGAFESPSSSGPSLLYCNRDRRGLLDATWISAAARAERVRVDVRRASFDQDACDFVDVRGASVEPSVVLSSPRVFAWTDATHVFVLLPSALRVASTFDLIAAPFVLAKAPLVGVDAVLVATLAPRDVVALERRLGLTVTPRSEVATVRVELSDATGERALAVFTLGWGSDASPMTDAP